MVDHHWKFKDDDHAKKVTLEGFDYVVLTDQDKELVR